MLLLWLCLLLCLCALCPVASILQLNATSTGALHHGKTPFPWGEVFHYPYFESEMGLLADEWVPMSYGETFRYYTVHEACVAFASHPKHCEGSHPSVDLGDCHIYQRGNLWPQAAACPNMKGNFLRHVSTRPWPQSAHVLDVVAKMKRLGARTLYFVGDSVTGQHFSEMHCSLLRFGGTFSRADSRDAVLNDPNQPTNNSTDDNKNEPYFRMHVGVLANANQNDLTKLKQHIEMFTHNDKGPVVFVINIGLHYNLDALERYRVDVRAFLRFFMSYAQTRGDIIIFRETSAQHFPTVNGLFHEVAQDNDYAFDLRKDELIDQSIHFSELMNADKRRNRTAKAHKYAEKPRFRMCRPLRTEQQLAENNWRNREMYAALDELDPQRKFVQVAQFHRVSAGRHDLHAIGADCTHFCSSPIIWYPLWQQINDIIGAKLV